MVPFPDAATETASCGDFQKYSVHGKADVLLSHFSLSFCPDTGACPVPFIPTELGGAAYQHI